MSSSKKKVLIVEDEPGFARSLELALGDEFEVVIAPTGATGLKKAQELVPDVVVLDINLPDQSGIDVLKKIRAHEATSTLPVLVLTNLSDSQTVSRIIASGGKEYLVKADWTINEVVEKVKSFV